MSELVIESRAVEDWMPQEAKELHSKAPSYFLELIENGVLENITSLNDLEPDRIAALEGGTGSACYMFQNNGEYSVLKLRTDSIDAEAEALNAWHEVGADVPEVFGSGIIPSTADSSLPVKYILMEGIVDTSGKGAPLASTYIDTNSSTNAEIAMLMGKDLAKMHQATSSRAFGPFGDISGDTSGVVNWNQFLLKEMLPHQRFLTEVGFNEEQINSMQQVIGSLPFSTEGVYLHNDFATRNTLVKATSPLSVCVLDPHPMVGDRHWDLAKQENRRGIAQKKFEAEPSNEKFRAGSAREAEYVDSLFSGYTATGKTIDNRLLTANTLVHALAWQGRREKVAERRFGGTEGKAWLAGNREVIREQANKVLSLAGAN